MSFIVRALGIGLAAAAAHLLMTATDDGEGGANIGAGLAVFAVLVVSGFVWALVDGLGGLGGLGGRRAGSELLSLGALLLRWVLVSVLAVAVLVTVMTVRHGGGYLSDVGASSVVFLGLLVLVPAVMGALIGYAARSTTVAAPGPGGPGHTG